MTAEQLIAAINAAKPRPDPYGDDARYAAEIAVQTFAERLIEELSSQKGDAP